MSDKPKYLLDFEPIGKRVEMEAGVTILDAAREAGIEIVSVCNGAGTCGQCQVQIKNLPLDPPTLIDQEFFSEDQLASGWRLACQSVINRTLKVFTPPDSLTTPQRLQVESQIEKALAASSFAVQDIILEEFNNLESVLPPELTTRKIQPELIKPFKEALVQHHGRLRIVIKNETILNWTDYGKPVYGLAVDLGTTKIAAYLVDLITGHTAAKSSGMNPQISYGEDVVNRILFCIQNQDGQKNLQSAVVQTLNDLSQMMCREVGAAPRQIIEAVIVGNTAMHHIFAGFPVKQLGLAPYSPAVTHAVTLPAKDFGLTFAEQCQIYFPENIAGYVGGDHVAMMIATEADTAQDTVLAIDIGTNTEVSLAHQGRIFTCSCASGPAFEGAHIKEGMRAADGAIERILIEGDQVQFQTIGQALPLGLCGSGILDAVAELKKNNILSERGRFDDSRPHVRGEGKSQEYVLVPAEKAGVFRDIVFTRKDVHEILLAKGAIQSGIQILLRTAKINTQDIDRVIVAGAFGSYLDLNSAMNIGMLPCLPIEKYTQVGNAAGSGARQLLISDEMRDNAKDFAQKAEYIELTSYPDFQNIYINALKFTCY